MRGGFSQELYIEWSTLCFSMCGKLLPVTSLDVMIEDDITYVTMIYELEETAAPLKFSDGTMGRALSYSYGIARMLATDIN